MLALPATPAALVLRTDFSDDGAWAQICSACTAESAEGFMAYLTFVSDPAFAGMTVEQVTALPSNEFRTFAFLVDQVTMTDPQRPLIVVDLWHEPGRWFRVIPSEMWGIESNLSISNMDFFEFADNTDPDGVFRGFR